MGFDAERRHMVETQLIPRQIAHPRVLAAMGSVPRHEFVPRHLAAAAYEDHPLGIGSGQTISQPYMVALMTQSLALEPSDRVLEIGTGSGYQTAILAELALHVYTIERIQSLADVAAAILARLGYTNFTVRVGDGTLGLPDEAPFDGIIVTAGAPALPEPLVQQLAEGGRLVCPVGDRFAQSLVVATRHADRLDVQHISPCIFVLS